MSGEEPFESDEFRQQFRLSGTFGIGDGPVYEHEQAGLLSIEPDESGEIVVKIRVDDGDIGIESSVNLSRDAARQVANSLRQAAVVLEAKQFSGGEEEA